MKHAGHLCSLHSAMFKYSIHSSTREPTLQMRERTAARGWSKRTCRATDSCGSGGPWQWPTEETIHMHVHVHQSKSHLTSGINVITDWVQQLRIVLGPTSIDMIPQTITSDIHVWLILVFRECSSRTFLFYQLVFTSCSHYTSQQIVNVTLTNYWKKNLFRCLVQQEWKSHKHIPGKYRS